MSEVTDNAPVDEQQADVSLHDALGEAFDAMDADDTDVGELDAGGESDEEVALSTEDGEEETTEDVEQEEGSEVELEWDEPAPERWPAEMREKYNRLPVEARKMLLDDVYKPMQKTYTQSTQELAQQRKRLGPMLETMEQYGEQFKQAGISPVEAFNRQMAWSAHFAKVGPEQGAKDLAAAYGHKPGQHESNDKADVYMTPVEKAQQAEIDRLKSQFQTVQMTEKQRQEQAQQAAFNARQNDVRGSIHSFASETIDGKPAHPHVEKVSAQMAGLIRGGLVDKQDQYGQPVPYSQQLGQAYKMACEMDPSIRTARTRQTNKEQVDKVIAGSRDVVSKTPGTVDVVDDGPLSATISNIYDRLDRSA